MSMGKWKSVDDLDKSDYQFVLVYDEEADVVRLALWNPSSKRWEEPPPEQMNITHYMEIPCTKNLKR
jgi:hypothetical protein